MFSALRLSFPELQLVGRLQSAPTVPKKILEVKTPPMAALGRLCWARALFLGDLIRRGLGV